MSDLKPTSPVLKPSETAPTDLLSFIALLGLSIVRFTEHGPDHNANGAPIPHIRWAAFDDPLAFARVNRRLIYDHNEDVSPCDPIGIGDSPALAVSDYAAKRLKQEARARAAGQAPAQAQDPK